MASIYEKEPIFLIERTWDDKTKLPEKHKFSGALGKKAEVNIDRGSLGMKFFLWEDPTWFVQGRKLEWCSAETFSKFENVLTDSYKTAWWEVIEDH